MAYYFNCILPSMTVALIVSVITVCSSRVKAMGALSPNDPSSYSRPEFAVMKHASLKLNVDFDKKVLNGSALLNFDVLEEAGQMILDVSGLTIESVETEDGKPLAFKVDGHVANFGSRLAITLTDDLSASNKANEALEKDAIIIKPSKSCPGCDTSLPKLSLTYNGLYFKPIIEEKQKELDLEEEEEDEKEINMNKKEKEKEIEECCPRTYIVENIHDPCDIGTCTCSIQTNTLSIVNIGCKGGPECSLRIEKEARKQEALNIDTKTEIGIQTDDETRKSIVGIDDTEARKSLDKGKKAEAGVQTDEGSKSIITGSDGKAGSDNSKKPIDKLSIRVVYSTAPTASALQWLDPQQTAGKKYPYMFSQCQPIHARSILPCQDTPSVKFTYDAEVTAPEEFTVLMSALRGDVKGNKATFNQPVPIPSYLLAIAVAVLDNKELGPRTKVWTEKEDLERSAWEFAETEKYLQAAEKLCGPYEWAQYDLLVLPPSFPYGGMENPCLTFVTPTLLAGDRSQADVIVHEIMHSWTGNLVTNKNFEHFWLNEGFTVFLERKVGASLIADKEEARKSRDFHSLLGLQELNETVNDELGPSNPLTKLVLDLKGVHPDDSFSTVPYEKGSLFLVYLETMLGGPEVFDEFLRAYLSRFARKSLDTDQFNAFLLNYFKDNDKLKTVDWDAWLYKPGMPPVIPNYDTSMTKSVTSLLAKIQSDAPLTAADVKSLSPHQVINLLQELVDRPPLSLDRLATLGREYKVADSNNAEIKYRWLRLCVRSRDEDKIPQVFDFVNNQGRMKYVRPLYRDLYAWQEVRDRAIDNFLKNEKNMMHVSAYTVRKDLHLNVLSE